MTSPELTLSTRLPEFDAQAFLVVDRRVRGVAWGGLRMVPDPSLEEMAGAARVMTFKYGWLGIPSGGAKAALQLPPGLEPRRAEVLRALGREWAGVLREGGWNPGVDMGCTVDDVRALLAGAGVRRDLSGWRDTSGIYTGWSVFHATLAALRARGESPAGRTFAIQGLGRVGAEYATLMRAAGARLVAASTLATAIHRPEGLDVPRLLELRARHGEDFLRHYPGARAIPHSALLELDVHVLVPAARFRALHAGNRDRVRAAVVACAANAPLDRDTERALTARGVTVVPDFVANCGGVLGTTLEPYLGARHIRALLEGGYAAKVERLLRHAAETAVPASELAEQEAEAHLRTFDTRGRTPAFRLARWALLRLPRALREPLAWPSCSRGFFRD